MILLRLLIYPLLIHAYYLGMILVRLSRLIPVPTTGFKTVRFAGSNRLKVDMSSEIGRAIYRTGLHHIAEILWLRKELKAGQVFIDVGANIGEFSVFASSRHCQTMAFEPDVRAYAILYQNSEINWPFSVHNVALSDSSEAKNFYRGEDSGLSSCYKTNTLYGIKGRVPCRIYDQSYSSRVDFIKIDTEGSELFVLRGMEQAIRKHKPTILIEINRTAYKAAGYDTADVLKLLADLDYVPFCIKRGKLIRIEWGEIEPFGNYVMKNNPSGAK